MKLPWRFPSLSLSTLSCLAAAAYLCSALIISAADSVTDPTSAALELFRAKGKSAEAQAAFEAIAAQDPKNHAAQLHLGLLAMRRDDTEKAIEYYERALALSPDHGDTHKAAGDAYGRSAQKASLFKQLGFAKKCVAAYERAVALDPQRVDYRLSLFEYYYRAPGLAGGGRDKALAQATTVKQLDPLAGRILFARISVDDKQYAEAFAQFEEAPDDYHSLYQIGRLSALTGQQPDRGLAALQRCLDLTPPPKPRAPSPAEIHWRIGTILEKKSDKPAARAAYGKALELDPNFAPARESLQKLK